MMNRKTLSVGFATVLALGFVACQSDSSSSKAPAIDSSSVIVPADDYTAGVSAADYEVKSFNAVADSGASTDAELALIYAEFPKLGKLAADIGSVDKVVMTEAGNFELYDGAELIAALAVSGSNLTVIWARDGFLMYSATYSLSAEEQTAPHGDMTFKLRECYEKEQEQEQGKKEEKAEEICEGLTVVITFEGETPKQEQEQKGKEEQEQEQKGKEPSPAPAELN